ncbi:uncharacterized protein LOC113288035 isoform X3 [Papaver somniferum]|uniref:uncharacterized protein LOC113288035 isoform X3 n=1 Tax=Papaver somniferum TaxID=3469 RepID=UPI000E6F4724|nr:uncharacterized protein LOC113288035 isoform X3 [Papaver somniferum]XP_026392757.1 uncharacterized protein LOC113288035 isoform X3 [Papaver somniferum]
MGFLRWCRNFCLDGPRQPTELELGRSFYQGKYIAGIAKKLKLLTHFFTIPRVFRQPEDVTHVLFDLELTIQRVKVIATPDDKQSHGPFFVVADTFSVFLIIWLGGGVLGCPAFNSSFRATHGSLSLNICFVQSVVSVVHFKVMVP